MGARNKVITESSKTIKDLIEGFENVKKSLTENLDIVNIFISYDLGVEFKSLKSRIENLLFDVDNLLRIIRIFDFGEFLKKLEGD